MIIALALKLLCQVVEPLQPVTHQQSIFQGAWLADNQFNNPACVKSALQLSKINNITHAIKKVKLV